MPASHDLVFLVDVDNTLLDNDRIVDDLRFHLGREFGAACAGRYWAHFEQLRDELGYADYLGALQRYRLEVADGGTAAHRLLLMSDFLVDYPFADRVYPGALEALARLRQAGPTVILSDGDVVFQPRKIQRSGLWRAVGGQVLVYVHKERMLDEIRRAFPARRYAIVDDKPRILGAFKAAWGDAVTTVFPRQGHYAFDAAECARHPDPDITLDHIGDLTRADVLRRLGVAGAAHEREHEETA
jgi:FMN phosphatase YigB (HAD superfamily)